jgi:hypothetical protein
MVTMKAELFLVLPILRAAELLRVPDHELL